MGPLHEGDALGGTVEVLVWASRQGRNLVSRRQQDDAKGLALQGTVTIGTGVVGLEEGNRREGT